MIRAEEASVLLEQLQQSINKLIATTDSAELGIPRVRCLGNVELNSDGYIRVQIEMKYKADKSFSDGPHSDKLDLNCVEEGT